MSRIITYANYHRKMTLISNTVNDDGEQVSLIYPPNDNPRVAEVNILPSKTTPGMVPTLKEMVEKYAQGGNVEVFTPAYTDNELLPDNWEKWDELTRIDYARNLKADLDQRLQTAEADYSDLRVQEDALIAAKQKTQPEPPKEEEPPVNKVLK